MAVRLKNASIYNITAGTNPPPQTGDTIFSTTGIISTSVAASGTATFSPPDNYSLYAAWSAVALILPLPTGVSLQINTAAAGATPVWTTLLSAGQGGMLEIDSVNFRFYNSGTSAATVQYLYYG